MDNVLLNKHIDDPDWAEVVRLYSGLFETQDEREDFIIKLADEDLLLAAECKTSSFEKEFNISNILIEYAYSKSINFKNPIETGFAILALLELSDYKTITNILKETYKRKPNLVHKKTIETVINNSDIEVLIQVTDMFLNNRKIDKIFIGWLAMSFSKNISDNYLNSKSFYNLINYLIRERYLEPIQYLCNKFGIKIFEKFNIKHIIENNLKKRTRKSINIAIFFIQKFGLGDIYSASVIVNKLAGENINELGIGKKKLIQSIITANNLESQFQDKSILPKIKTTNKNLFEKVIPKNTAINDTINLNDWVVCYVINIIPSRIFVKIEGENKSVSIYIGELTTKRLNSINAFEYDGVKIYIGQKLIAKVISIDEKFGINLSLKQE